VNKLFIRMCTFVFVLFCVQSVYCAEYFDTEDYVQNGQPERSARIKRPDSFHDVNFTEAFAYLQDTNVTSLILNHCDQLTKLPDGFASLPLRTLVLANTGMTTEGLAGKLPASLEWLNLDVCSALKNLPNGFESLPNLATLSLSNTPINKSDLENKLPNSLKMLHLFSYKSSDGFPNLSHLQLKELSLNGDCVTGYVFEKLPASLEKLNLFGATYIQTIPDLTRFNNLRELDLGRTKATAAWLGKLPGSLKTLRLYDCKALTSLSNNEMLENLNVLDLVKSGVEALFCVRTRANRTPTIFENAAIPDNQDNRNVLTLLNALREVGLVEAPLTRALYLLKFKLLTLAKVLSGEIGVRQICRAMV
jgi:hypothetical protein